MLIWVACAFACGIWLGDAAGLGISGSLLAALAAAGALAFARAFDRWIGVATLLLAWAIGLVSQAARPRAPPALVDGIAWVVEGSLARDPERSFGKTRLF